MESEATIAAIRRLMETEGITIADLESEGVVGGETVAGFFDQALAAMTDSTRDRYEPYLQILRDGLDETCWCLCEKCCGYVNSVCRCYDGCGCDTDKRIPVLEVATGGTVTKGIDRGGGCRARLVGMGTVPLAAVTTGHLIVVQSWVRQRGKKRWIAANARRADQGRPQHVRDGRSAEENYVSATRRFFRAAVSDGHIRTSPAADLDKPKRKRPENRALTEARLDELWDALWTTGSDDPELDMLIVWTQLETGARRAGILGLTVDRVRADTQTIKVVEKYNESRQQPVSPELIEALQRFAQQRGGPDGAQLRPGSPVFYYKPTHDKKGHPKPPQRLTVSRFDTLYRRLRERLPWADELFLRPHDLRKTAGSFVERIAGNAVARQFLGHAYADPTDLYVAASDAEVAEAFAQMAGLDHHPRMNR